MERRIIEALESRVCLSTDGAQLMAPAQPMEQAPAVHPHLAEAAAQTRAALAPFVRAGSQAVIAILNDFDQRIGMIGPPGQNLLVADPGFSKSPLPMKVKGPGK